MNYITIVAIGVSIVLMVLLTVIYFNSKKQNVDINFIIIALVMATVGNGLAILPNNVFSRIGSMLLTTCFIFIFFHYETIARSTPLLPLMGVIIALYAAVIVLDLNLLFYFFTPSGTGVPLLFSANSNILDFDNYFLRNSYVISFTLQTILTIIVLIRSIQIIGKINSNVQSGATRTELTGLIFLLIYRGIFLFRFVIPFEMVSTAILWGLITAILGVLLLVFNYALHSDYLYFLPFPIHTFMIYNKIGLLCYSRLVKPSDEFNEDKGMLMSGAFSAISAMIQESLGSQAKIQHINAQQYQIFFIPIGNDEGTLVVISYGESGLFKKSLKRFISIFDRGLVEEINYSHSDINALEPKLDKVIQKSYPYVKFIQLKDAEEGNVQKK